MLGQGHTPPAQAQVGSNGAQCTESKAANDVDHGRCRDQPPLNELPKWRHRVGTRAALIVAVSGCGLIGFRTDLIVG